MKIDMDRMVALLVKRMVKKSKSYSHEKWKPGEKLKILLVGYNGKRNTGADVRVAAMVDQFYSILGKENIEIGILTLSKKDSEIYFKPPTKLIEFSSIFFKPLLDACSSHHLIVISEGSTLKSKFANSLTLFFVEAMGIASRQGKPCIAYGSEAGEMDGFVYKIAKELCKDTYFIARTQQSMDIIREMGLQTELGTDTAWTFPPAREDWAEKELLAKGWDGKKPILGVAVINPFYWPVKPSLLKLLLGHHKRHPEEHYEKYYFFSSSRERRKLFSDYLTAIARAVDDFAEKNGFHVIIFGMEALDYDAITKLQRILKIPAETFSSKFYDGYQLTSLLRKLSLLVTSRYHARVLSMPAGVPSIAVSMDERLYNIFHECGDMDYYFEVDDPELYEKLSSALEKLWENRKKVSREILQIVPEYLRRMAGMGETFRRFVERNFPGLSLPPEPEKWMDYLPPLYPELEKIVKSS
jgi:polysaccharide pyruvyl transferase WcaK-like protein